MLHHHTLIFNVVILQLVGVVKVDQEDLCHEVLHDLPIPLHWEHSLLCLALDLNQMDLVLVIKNGCPPITQLHTLNVVFALNFIDFLTS